MIRYLVILHIALIQMLCCCALAQSTHNAATPYFTAVDKASYCPALNELTLDTATRIWSAPGGWKSYEQSFATEITQFLGAQWIGIEIGQIACIYAGKEKYTFPILLIYNTLVQAPKDGAWQENTKDGYYHCTNSQINQCPFYPVKKRQSEDFSNLQYNVGTTATPNSALSQQQSF